MAELDSNSGQPGLADPPAGVWEELGVVPEVEVHGGFQSRVFLARRRSDRLIVKLVEAGDADADAVLRDRVDLIRRLAEINPSVVGPLTLGAESVVAVDRWNAVCYPYVEGTRPDTGDRLDVEAMAATLGALHDSLAALPNPGLPPVAALGGSGEVFWGEPQLIHGDYAASNLILTGSGLKVIDFDECGQGSIEFEIGNTLYMVLFDAWRCGAVDRYNRFRSWFVAGYQRATSVAIEDSGLDSAIRIRAAALERWLATPAEAPTGIRASSQEWREQLRRFVDEVLS